MALDAGATHLRAQAFQWSQGRLSPASLVVRARFPDFQPVAAGDPDPKEPGWEGSREGRAAGERLDMAANILGQVAHGLGQMAQVAVAWPGLKCSQGDSIMLSLNGPRIPDLRGRLERTLRERGFPLQGPLPPLQSDGEMAGWGEEVAPDGSFGGVDSAYLLMAGTGLAEAFKRQGQLVPRSAIPGALAPYAMPVKPWGGNCEQHLRASAWGNGSAGGASRADRCGLLEDLLKSRLELLPLQRIVLGGRFREILTEAEVLALLPGGPPVRLSRLTDPALWGCAAYLIAGAV